MKDKKFYTKEFLVELTSAIREYQIIERDSIDDEKINADLKHTELTSEFKAIKHFYNWVADNTIIL